MKNPGMKYYIGQTLYGKSNKFGITKNAPYVVVGIGKKSKDTLLDVKDANGVEFPKRSNKLFRTRKR